jgi:CarD family transcriptional regulator
VYEVNENVVYPGHGVARISRILNKSIGGNQTEFFELKFLNKDMTILVPTDNIESVGIRKLSSNKRIKDIFEILMRPAKRLDHHEFSPSSWNKRYKLYQNKIRTGNLEDISKIYRDLQHMTHNKELSFGEKNLLTYTETLLAQEISIVKKLPEEEAIKELRSVFRSFCNCHIVPNIDI